MLPAIRRHVNIADAMKMVQEPQQGLVQFN
jgi:hypothetical protein